MIFEIVKPNPSSKAKLGYIILASLLTTGLVLGLVLDKNYYFISITISFLALGILILLTSYRFLTNREYLVIGKIYFNENEIIVKSEPNRNIFILKDINQINLIYRGYNGEPAGYGLGLRRGYNNQIEIIKDNDTFKYKIFLANISQKKLLFNQLNTLTNKNIAVNISII